MKHARKVVYKSTEKGGGHRLFEVGNYIRRLQKNAAKKGEPGLVISLSRPFHQLFKYHLMFQNLFSHSSVHSTEYESALKVIAEVEMIIGSIDDGGIQEEERNMTRDVLRRIEGLGTAKQFAVPKPSRVLIRECGPGRVLPPSSGTPPSGAGGEKKLWFVVFNDVVLRCHEAGITSLPRWGARYTRTALMIQDLSGPQVNCRNLYKYIGV